MKNLVIRLIYVIAIGFSLSGCGVSPLLNHQSADSSNSNESGKSAQRDANATDCALSFPRHEFCAELTWNSRPNDREQASFYLRFWNTKQGTKQFGPLLDPNGTVNVVLWMPAMGHGSAPVTLKHARDLTGQNIPGIFLGSSVYFIMPGSWDVHVQLKDGSSVSEEAIESVHI